MPRVTARTLALLGILAAFGAALPHARDLVGAQPSFLPAGMTAANARLARKASRDSLTGVLSRGAVLERLGVGDDVTALIAQADGALYAAKAGARNRTEVFRPVALAA